MKLNKKTIYRVKTQELFDKMMEDAKKQGYTYLTTNIWTGYKENTGVRIDEKGDMHYCSMSYYLDAKKTDYKDYYYAEYKDVPEIYPINFGCVGIDAPNFEIARRMFTDYMSKLDTSLYGIVNPKVYTIRVEDNNTTVITPDGKCATAKCHPDDDFDVVEGFRVAMEKIREMDRKLTDDEKTVLNVLKTLGIETFYISDNEVNGITDDEDILATIIIEEDDFKWCEEYENYSVAELLEKYA